MKERKIGGLLWFVLGILLGFSFGAFLAFGLQSSIGRWVVLGVACIPVVYVLGALIWTVLQELWEEHIWYRKISDGPNSWFYEPRFHRGTKR